MGLPPRNELVESALAQAKSAYFDTNLAGENTVLSSAAHGGVTGWLNRSVLDEEKSFEFFAGITLSVVLDKVYQG